MGFWQRLFSADGGGSSTRDPLDDFWYGQTGRATMAQVNVTIERSRKVPVVRDSLAVLAQSVAGLTFGVFRWVSAADRERVDAHPVMRLLLDPNPRATSYEFIADMVDDLASAGYFLGRLEFTSGQPTRCDRIPPAQVEHVELLADGSLRWRYRDDAGTQRTLLESEAWFMPVPPKVNSYQGRSAVLDDGREAIGALIALQDYANAFWGNDATPPFVFKHASHFKDEEHKKTFLQAWKKLLTGRRRGNPGILEYGIELQELGQSNEASQFLDTRKELQLDIARLWRMPPHKIQILDKATFSNIEQQSLEFVTDTLVPWLRLIERSANKRLIGSDEFYFQFNVASLLRGDTKARFEAYQKGRQWGWLSVNEVRALENMNGIGPAGDRYIEPLNMIEAGADRDQGRQQETTQALRVLHASVPAIPKIKTHTADALDAAMIEAQRRDGAALRLVGNG